MHPQSDLILDTPVTGADELAEGLMLVRASTLKVIRLQLAMERGDRRVAIEAIDGLVALDRRLEKYLESVPFHGYAALEQATLLDRSALNGEKLTLAAEVRWGAGRKGLFEGPPVADPTTSDLIAEPSPQERGAHEAEWVPERYEENSPWWRWIVALLLLLMVVAGAAFALGAFAQLPPIERIVEQLP